MRGVDHSTVSTFTPSVKMTVAVAAVLAWGVLPFGAVHGWAAGPLALLVGLCGAWMWSVSPPSSETRRLGFIAFTLLGPVALQLVPLGAALLDGLAPATAQAVASLDLTRQLNAPAAHPLSIAPKFTLQSLAALALSVLWVAGLRRTLHVRPNVQRLAAVIAGLGLLVALLALVQKATFNGRIYWIWESEFKVASNYYGPFVNRNHFAGWMLLALSVSAGYFVGLVAAASRRVKPALRERVLWLGSPEGSRLLLLAASVAVMLLSLIWSMSRSGMAGAAMALLILASATMRRMHGFTRLVAVGSIALLLAGAAAWKGIDVLAAQYGRTHTLEWRVALWRDSIAPLREFFVFGSGLNTYGTLMLLYPQTDPTVHAQQAHNDYLELAIEGGLLVMIPWAIGAVLVGTTIARAAAKPQDETAWWVRMGAVAGICGIAVQETSDFSLQIPGVALLFATLVALATHEPPLRVQEPASRMRSGNSTDATGGPPKLRLHSSRRLEDSRSSPSFPGR